LDSFFDELQEPGNTGLVTERPARKQKSPRGCRPPRHEK
jgi:hypothetical protein